MPGEACGVSTPALLPFYVQPAPQEALISWFWRLVTHAGVSALALGRGSFGVGPRLGLGAAQWWRHPDPMLLAQISRCTGLNPHALREMTFLDHAPSVRDDEVVDRFNGSRFILRPPKWRSKNRFVVCAPCLQSDQQPYVRLLWTMGWIAVCPQHSVLLQCECPTCGKPLRPPPLFTTAGTGFAPRRCIRCGMDLCGAPVQSAHAAVMSLQAAMVHGKRYGVTTLPGLGLLSWPLTITAADVLLGIIWKGSYRRHLLCLYARISEDLSLPWRPDSPQWTRRYGSLLILAWLLDRWPTNLRAALVILGAPRMHRAVPDWDHIPERLRRPLQEQLDSVRAPRRRDGRSSRKRNRQRQRQRPGKEHSPLSKAPVHNQGT
jgi:hypothetical protein